MAEERPLRDYFGHFPLTRYTCEIHPESSLFEILSGFTSLRSTFDTLDPSVHAPPISSPSVPSVDVSHPLLCTHYYYADHMSHDCPTIPYPSKPILEHVYPYDTVPEPTSAYYFDTPNPELC